MPVLMLDKKKCLANIERMAVKADRHRLRLRPHFKTHQSAEIGNWFFEFGVSGITVSSFRMAGYFARAGWKDILVAFPFNPHDLDSLNGLAASASLSILLDNPETLRFLDRLQHPAGYYIDIDTGYGRTGIKSGNTESIERLLAVAGNNKKLIFKGFYCHAGHSYKARDRMERDEIHRKARTDLERLKSQFSHLDPLALFGDTPNCSIQDDFTGIDEITPGNFVFYDLFQHSIGSCTLEDIAVSVACPVTGKYPERREILIHGGAVHFSKESLHSGNREVFGRLVVPKEGNSFSFRDGNNIPDPAGGAWKIPEKETWITGITQEHGIIDCGGEVSDRVRIGDVLCFLPVHSCLAANLAGEYRTTGGEYIGTLNSA